MNDGQFQLGVILEMVRGLEQTNNEQLQKLGYLLQESRNIPTGYRFKMHQHGPYSDELDTNIGLLRRWKFITAHPQPERAENLITPSTTLDEIHRELEAEWQPLLKPHQETIQEATDGFRGKTERELHLTAGIHFVRKLTATRDLAYSLGQVDRMLPRITLEEITRRYQEMVREGWITEQPGPQG